MARRTEADVRLADFIISTRLLRARRVYEAALAEGRSPADPDMVRLGIDARSAAMTEDRLRVRGAVEIAPGCWRKPGGGA